MNDRMLSWEEAVKWLREQPDQKELVEQCYYDDPLEKAAERYNKSEEWGAVKGILQGCLPGNVLDLGAGRGISSYAFAKSGCSVTAIEPDPSQLVGAQAILKLVKKTGVKIKVVQEYGEVLPFDADSVDIVYGRAVLHHAKNLKKLCSEAYRVLKKRGVFIATREHVISDKKDLNSFLKSHPLHFLYGGENAFLLHEYIDAIKASGFSIKKVIGPFDSVINYSPMTQKDFHKMISNEISPKLGNNIGEYLSNKKFINRILGKRFSKRSSEAGRLYSFLAVKL